MDIVELAQQQGWSPSELRSQVVRCASAIGMMELERMPGSAEVVMGGIEQDGVVQELVIRRFRPPLN